MENNIVSPLLPAGRARSARPAGPKITLPFLRLYVRLHLSRAQQLHHIHCCHATLQAYFSWFRQFRRLLCVAARVVYHSYDFEMDTEKQRQRRRDNARLTESGNARSEQLNTRDRGA